LSIVYNHPLKTKVLQGGFELHYNKKGQGFDVIGHFTLTDVTGKTVHYSRVRFFDTKHEHIFPTELVKAGEIYDASFEELLEDEVIEVKEESKEEIVREESVSQSKIIAISPKGEEIEVSNLEEFCAKNKLDLEVVQAILEGKQKTHRKWRFTKA
jgi:hypothetical protein